jgi:hypothetical protein
MSAGSGAMSVSVRDEALTGGTPCPGSAADRDRVKSVLDEYHSGRLGVGVALSEHGYRHSYIGRHPAGMKPIERYVCRTRDVPELEMRSVADVYDHVISERRGEVAGLH